jgi:hypothetical protein
MGTFNARRLSIERLESRFALSADFSGNNVVDADDLAIWQANYGTVNTATQSQGDADDDFDVDGRDFLAWQRQFGNISLVAPRNVHARALGLGSVEVTWDASVNATDYLVARRRPDSEIAFTIIAPNVVGTSYTDSSGLVSGVLYEYVLVAQRNPSSAPSQVAQVVADSSNLTAYRPQGVYDPDDTSTPNPKYDPFPRRPVREQDEGHPDFGPGIRINNDDDDNNGVSDRFQTGAAITRENDLIEVRVERLPGLGDMVLTKNSQLSLFFDHAKANLVPLDEFGNTTLPLPFDSNDTVTIWVEWTSTTHGSANLTLYEVGNPSALDTVRFHSFESLIIVFGGNTQKPADTDGDGSIGDPVGGSGNREGIFDAAQFMYDSGWDVLAFNENEFDKNNTNNVPYTEVVNARQQRFVTYHGIIGYSQGGGATHDLIEMLWRENDINTNIGVYIDAVHHIGPSPMVFWPEGVFYLLNIFEINPWLHGGAIIDYPGLPFVLDEIDTEIDSRWNGSLSHSSIDDDPLVLDIVISRLHSLLPDR